MGDKDRVENDNGKKPTRGSDRVPKGTFEYGVANPYFKERINEGREKDMERGYRRRLNEGERKTGKEDYVDVGWEKVINELNISYKISSKIEEIVNRRSIDLDTVGVLLQEPFTGDFSLYINGENIMPKGLRKMYPFAYIEWLINNYNTYMNESIDGKTNDEINSHLFAYGLGDASPKILLYRDGCDEIIKPTLSKSNQRIRVEVKRFSNSLDRVSQYFLAILDRNPMFRQSNRLKLIKEMMRNHYIR
ncbi:MAG: hypothetical protein ABIB79_04845 [archaeon]